MTTMRLFLLCVFLTVMCMSQACSADMRSPVTIHALDQLLGYPAANVQVDLSFYDGKTWHIVNTTVTDNGGRAGLLPTAVFNGPDPDNVNCCFDDESLQAGEYSLTFHTTDYIRKTTGKTSFFPQQVIYFTVDQNQTMEYFHIPLLFTAGSFTSYRGSCL